MPQDTTWDRQCCPAKIDFPRGTDPPWSSAVSRREGSSGCGAGCRVVTVEQRQEVLQLVETPDDLVETLFDGGQACGHSGIVRICDVSVRSWGVFHGGVFPSDWSPVARVAL